MRAISKDDRKHFHKLVSESNDIFEFPSLFFEDDFQSQPMIANLSVIR